MDSGTDATEESFFNNEFAWVTPGEPLWAVDGSKRTDVHIDWIRDLGFDLAEAYKTTADFAIDRLASGGDGTHPDRFALPILYLYRHAFELRLKDLIRLGLRLPVFEPSGKIQKLLTQEHNLLKLWRRVSQVLKSFWPDTDGKDLAQISEYLELLNAVDPDGQRLRYDRANPKSNKSDEDAMTADRVSNAIPLTVEDLLYERKEDRELKPPAVSTLPDLFGLIALRDRMTKIDRFLSGSIDGITNELEARDAAARDYADDYNDYHDYDPT